MKKFFNIMAVLVAAAVIGAFGYPAVASILASGRVEYCYVQVATYHTPMQPDTVAYYMWGFRNWRPDRELATNLKSMDDVRSNAEKYGCELK